MYLAQPVFVNRLFGALDVWGAAPVAASTTHAAESTHSPCWWLRAVTAHHSTPHLVHHEVVQALLALEPERRVDPARDTHPRCTALRTQGRLL